MRITRLTIYLLIGVFLAQCVYYYPNLPEVMASHFDGAGLPNGWMSKTSFFIIEAVVLLFIMGEFLLLPFLIDRLPAYLINLPNRDYWLAPERSEETFASIRNYLEWFCILLISLFIAVNQMVFTANIAGKNLPSRIMWLVLGLFFAFLILWLVKFIGRFKIKYYES